MTGAGCGTPHLIKVHQASSTGLECLAMALTITRVMMKITDRFRIRALVREKLLQHSRAQIFTRIYQKNSWGHPESVSGSGSDSTQTRIIRRELAALIKELNIRTLLDAPCGDYYWMKEVERPLTKYIGVDIVPELIESNQRMYGSSTTTFTVTDIAEDELPKVDLIFCRDCLNKRS
jgi:hypothetical protein